MISALLASPITPLENVLKSLLDFFHNSAGLPWAWSIVALTILVRICLVPLVVRQIHSMQNLQAHAPQMKEIQRKYKADRQKMNEELMKFYKENNVNPLSSCLPLVAQLPVFISLFYMLRSSLRVDICPQEQPGAHMVNGHWVGINHAHTVPCGPHNGAEFLFIPDLTNKATGAVLVVLILLYVGTQLASSLMMSSSTMDKTQRQIMLVLPLFFVIFIISFPAGVIVYWITTNTWTIGQQYIIKKRIGPMGPLATATSGAGPPGGGGESSGPEPGDSDSGPNGAGSGGLSGLLRGRQRQPQPESVASGSSGRGSKPPPPPRKKKKRSGRRR